jgi:hypothetical protein
MTIHHENNRRAVEKSSRTFIIQPKYAYRAGAGVALLAALLLFWINGAVGIIGSEDNPANLMYGGILLVAACGALLARLRPGGMALAMKVTGIAQFAVFVVAWAAGWAFTGPITLFFYALWLTSARLFRKAAT